MPKRDRPVAVIVGMRRSPAQAAPARPGACARARLARDCARPRRARHALSNRPQRLGAIGAGVPRRPALLTAADSPAVKITSVSLSPAAGALRARVAIHIAGHDSTIDVPFAL